MLDPNQPVAAILAGGQSSRYGSAKSEALLGGRTLAQRVHDALAPGSRQVAVVGDLAGLASTITQLSDAPGAPPGPLAGVLAALRWAEGLGAHWLVTAPCDTPLLPSGLATRLGDRAREAGAPLAVACGADGRHPLIAAWSVGLTDRIAAALAGAHPPVHRLVAECGATDLHLPAWALANINTPADMQRILREPVAGGPLGDDAQAFAFELAAHRAASCIPMRVRARLDRSALKLSKDAWLKLSTNTQNALAMAPCDTPLDIHGWRERVVDAAQSEGCRDIEPDDAPAWAEDALPPTVERALALAGTVIALSDWRGLRPLQRFALTKLAQRADTRTITMALAEFGLR